MIRILLLANICFSKHSSNLHAHDRFQLRNVSLNIVILSTTNTIPCKLMSFSFIIDSIQYLLYCSLCKQFTDFQNLGSVKQDESDAFQSITMQQSHPTLSMNENDPESSSSSTGPNITPQTRRRVLRHGGVQRRGVRPTRGIQPTRGREM